MLLFYILIQGAVSVQQKAAEMKQFGKLTRETTKWRPNNLLCKRFNVPNPYPEYVSPLLVWHLVNSMNSECSYLTKYLKTLMESFIRIRKLLI